MEAMEKELESGQEYLEMELGQNREELEKFKDKFRRYGHSKNFKGDRRGLMCRLLPNTPNCFLLVGCFPWFLREALICLQPIYTIAPIICLCHL